MRSATFLNTVYKIYKRTTILRKYEINKIIMKQPALNTFIF